MMRPESPLVPAYDEWFVENPMPELSTDDPGQIPGQMRLF